MADLEARTDAEKRGTYEKRILLLTTGGTIASQDGGTVWPPVLSSDDFLDYMKDLKMSASSSIRGLQH